VHKHVQTFTVTRSRNIYQTLLSHGLAMGV